MKAVFADTFYWIALTNPADSCYEYATSIDEELAGATIFTTDEVLGEFLTFFIGTGTPSVHSVSEHELLIDHCGQG